ncbi:MAG: HAMP domain-containing sensor histidine kinase [Flavobacteriales bacterium]|jgi:signal transduction histidine kinase|nr:MAG: HAMP domain-containing sensor histidine kinase [Flavobacteriales bacterium]
MRLLNRSLLHLSVVLLLVLAAWAVAFFFIVRHAVVDSIDEGLEDQEEIIRHRLEQDSTLLRIHDLGLHGFAFAPVAQKVKTSYRDTVLFVPSEGKQEPVRLLTKSFPYNGGYQQLRIYTSTVEEDDLIEDILAALIGLYITLLLTIIIVNNVVLRRVWRPFHAILDQLKGFRLGSGRSLADVPTEVSEFRELKAAASALVRHAMDTYENQRAFTENAAHELQTPLAIAINRLELLAERPASEEERMAAVGEVIASLERLTRLNKSLLLLARIENRQFPDEQPISFTALLRDVAEEFADLAAHRQVELGVQADGDLVRSMDPGLARILLNNLVKNAIMHNVPGGTVKAQVDATGLTIRNTAASGPLDPARIFGRFHKETTADGGTGLGLAIANAIAQLYGLRITYAFDDGHVMRLEATA